MPIIIRLCEGDREVSTPRHRCASPTEPRPVSTGLGRPTIEGNAGCSTCDCRYTFREEDSRDDTYRTGRDVPMASGRGSVILAAAIALVAMTAMPMAAAPPTIPSEVVLFGRLASAE